MSLLISFLLGMAIMWFWLRPAPGAGDVPPAPAATPGDGNAPSLTAATSTGGDADSSASTVAAAGANPNGADQLVGRIDALLAAVEAEANAAPHPRDLLTKPNFLEVRHLLAEPDVSLDVVRDFALGPNWVLATAALAAILERQDRDEALSFVQTYFESLPPWAMYFALRLFLAVEARPPAGLPLIAVREWWRDNMFLVRMFREYFEDRDKLGDAPAVDNALDAATPEQHEQIRVFLQRIGHPYAVALAENLQVARARRIDRTFLATIGRFWPSQGGDVLIEPTHWKSALTTAKASLTSAQPRSLLVTGDARVGKTSFLRLLAERLQRQGWTVFEASGADLMAGQQWFGQLEGRIQRLIDELPVSKKVVWYIPDILQIAMSGTHQGQSASILEQILPAISSGRLVVWTETSPAGLARLVRLRAGLRGTFEVAAIEPMDAEETAELATACAAGLTRATGVAVDAAAIPAAIATARQYLAASSLPGAALDLIKLSAARAAKEKAKKIGAHDIVETLAQLTGLPVSILDSNERVDLAAVRSFFASRVIGQEEAVETIVARIAMLKAGLNDPGKPIGVFLFAGPTGTGKTEIAKTVAEFLFGSEDRLLRLDMSEFQTADSTSKILGSGDGAMPAESLITQVRKQPFSVVLLDEFEKAHANIWDLFLQVFDDGRLSDQLGQVADFRHCIIILTSNLGATSHRTSRLGFAPGEDTYSSDQVLRAVSQTFRPEFQNRLDKVIVFKPLSRAVMRGILQKELSRVLERRGLKDREWAVEWEASALEFLLEKGFSPEMGARPLKRAIDQYLIAPLAATIVEKRFPEGDQFVFVRSDGNAIQAEFVDPDADELGQRTRAKDIDASGKDLALPSIILGPEGNDDERDVLEAELLKVDETILSDAWENRKAALAAEMQTPQFWASEARFATLSRLALIDRVRAATETARSLKARLDKVSETSGKSSRELISRLALQLHVVNEGIRDVSDDARIEVALMIEPALERPGDEAATAAWCERLLGMYRAWGRNRHMHVTDVELAGIGKSLPILLVSGFGAGRALESEKGLHVFEMADDDDRGARATARVRIANAPLGDLSVVKLRQVLKQEFDRAAPSNAVVRRYRSEPAPLVRDVMTGWRSGRLDEVLAGDFDLIAAIRS